MASDVCWDGVRRAKRGVTSVPGVAGLHLLPTVGRPDSVASTRGNTPPCEVAKQMHSLSESRDHEKPKENTFHALSKCLGNAGRKTSWDSDCGRETVLNRGSSAALCVQGRGKEPTPPLPIWASGCYLTCKIQTLNFRKYPICVFLCDSCVVIALLMHYAGA